MKQVLSWPRSLRRPLAALCAFVAAFVGAAPAQALAAPVQERDTAGIIEEQELLKRQLLRLRRTIEGLIPRLEQEGRPRALELLREGLQLLEARAEATQRQTIDELMDTARAGVQSGQAVQSLEHQEAVIGALERLVAILLDRQSMESLESALEQLRALRKDLQGLKERENKLEQHTNQLREDSKSEEQQALEEQLRQLASKQRELLERNEALARERGTGSLEQIERELAELLERQQVDREVLEAWQPDAAEGLRDALTPLDEARRAAARAERLRAAANELRNAAAAARAAQASEHAQAATNMQAATNALDQAAEREERHQRAATEGSVERAAKALRESAGEMRTAAADGAARQRAAETAEARAAELEQAATEQESAANAARKAALEALAGQGAKSAATPTTEPNAAAGAELHERGRQTRAELERAIRDYVKKPDAAQEAARATERAAEALRDEAEQEQQLGPALSASQTQAAQTSERLQRGIQALPPQAAGQPPIDEQRAEQALAKAAQAMKSAASAARGNEPRQAADQARQAEQRLQEALAALSQAREQRSAQGSSEQAAQAEAMLREQSQLASAAAQAKSKANEAASDEPGQRSVEAKIESARAAMERAASEMKSGRSSSAAGSQREALDALDQALREADRNARPTEEADRKRADELASEQKAVQRELLDLATRNEQRKNAKPSPSLSSAAKKAGEAGEALEQGELESAERKEEQVQRDLDQALADLSEEEEQYQRLRQEELLFRITEEVTALIEGQRDALVQVREVDAGRASGAAPSRAERLRLRRVARDEAQLAARANEISASIEAEQSFVFAQVLREVQQDLERISRDIDENGDYQTGERVQGLMEDSIETSGWVLEALKKEQRDREQQQKQEQQQQQNQQGQNQNRLVPDVAELKLLRKLEVETQGSLNRLLLVYPELETRDVAPEVLEDVLRLAERHERTSQLFQKFRARLGVPGPDDQPDSQ